jgi:hypothetical protein
VRTIERLTEAGWQSYYDFWTSMGQADWYERWAVVRSETRVPVRLVTLSGLVEREFWPFSKAPLGVR